MYVPKLREAIHAILATSSFQRTSFFYGLGSHEVVNLKEELHKIGISKWYIFMNDADCRGALVNMSVCFHFHYILRRL